MDATLPLALLAMGLVSGAHCLGMCGGIVTAFSARQPLIRKDRMWARQAVFNAGRITSYSFAGLVAGTTGLAFQGSILLYLLVNVLLIFVGLQLAGVRAPMLGMEKLGAPLWRRVQPLAARTLANPSLPGAYAAGAVWGWLPCGLVYAALATAALAGSPARGAAAMAAFGLGTLAWLMAAGVAAASLRSLVSRRPARITAGTLVIGFGAWGLAHSLILGGHT
jgi:hypothetical protein